MHNAPSLYQRYPGAATPPKSSTYTRREPEKSVLYGIVDRNRKTCLSQAEEKSEHGYGYPQFVGREFDKFLECGQLRRGFVRIQCADCPNEKLIAFSCKGRGICPSCTARRMTNTAAHLVDHVLPVVPYRQWVISFPRRVRFLLARDAALLSAVLAMSLRKLFAWQKRAARKIGVLDPMCGAVSFVQRFGSLVNLNCHAHNLLPDGVFVQQGEDLIFRPTPPPWREDVQRLVKQIARGTEKIIRAWNDEQDASESYDILSAEQAQSLASTFPESHAPMQQEGTTIKGQRIAFHYGYSLHCERILDAEDREGLEKLCRYGARAPIANSRLSLDKNGDAILKLKRPLRDGRRQLRFTQLELLQKLAILIPPPRKNLTRYFGVFAPAHHHRARAVAVGRVTESGSDDTAPAEDTPKPRPKALSWSQLLRRVFAIDILKCDLCGGPMRILAVIPEGDASEAILDHLDIEMPVPKHLATGPPQHHAAH